MWQDLKFSSRRLFRHPISNLIIVLTIGLLVGAISTIYASLKAQSESRLPFPDNDELVKFWRLSDTFNSYQYPYSFYVAFKESLGSFKTLGAFDRARPMTMTGTGEPYTFSAMKGTASLLAMTGIPPHLGRLFNDADEAPGNARVILLTHKTWRERFFEEKEVIGRKILLNDRDYEIVGVLDPSMDHTALGYTQIWLPLRKPTSNNTNIAEVAVIGRTGGSFSKSENEFKALSKVLESQHTPSKFEKRIASNGFNGARMAPLQESLSKLSRESQKETIGIFIFAGAIMVCVVLIACFNITNLLLLRATSRAREIAIRLSIGASRFRIIRQLLAETLLLSLFGAGLGLSVSQILWGLFNSQHLTARFDPGLYAISAISAIILGALVGVLPAFQSSKSDFNEDLKDGSHASVGKQRHRLRNLLVAAQVGMAIILCVGSAIMTRSYLNMQRTELGFDPSRMMTVTARLQQPNYRNSERARQFVTLGVEYLQQHPGVEEAAASFSGPLTYFSFSEEVRFRNGTDERTALSGSWFTTANLPEMVGLHVVRGRTLSPDTAPLQPEILINEMFVSEYLEGIDPVGLDLHIRSLDQWMTVVGVVRDRSPLTSFQNPKPEFYASYRHSNYHSEASFLVRTSNDVKAASNPIRETIKRIDRNQPISPPKFLPDLIQDRLAGPKSAMIFLTLFASCGVIIAVLGIYGVVSFTVAERTREVGIRMALGAEKSTIRNLLMGQGLRLLAIGGVPGLLIAFAVVQGIPSRVLYKLTPWDPATYFLVIAIVTVTGTLACLAPATKASNLNPMRALRHE